MKMTRDNRTNILFVLTGSWVGGAEHVVLNLARNLNPSKFNIYAAFFNSGALEPYFAETCDEIFYIWKKAGFDLSAMLEISRIIEEKNIDVINAHHYMPFFYSYLGGKILHKRKLVYTEHSVPEVESILHSKHKYLCNFMLRNTDVIVGVSREIGETISKGFPIYSGKIKSILNGLDIDRFNTSVRRDQIRAEWGLLPEHFIVGAVANFWKIKNHPCLIRAFHCLSTKYPHIRLVLVGRDVDNYEQEIKRLIHENMLTDRVVFAGYRDDIPGILKSFDAFCLPSFSEGLPVSVLEAMAARIPVVGSNVSGIKEVISPKKTGLLFSSNNDQELAGALELLITNDNLRDKLVKEAYAFVNENHGLSQWVSKYEELFEKV